MTEVICDLPRDDRPRERLFKHGPATLSNSELVAILLGSGLPGKNAIQLARELLADGIAALKGREWSFLSTIAGIGPAKAARIAAAFEISRRLESEEPEEPPSFDATVLGRALVSQCAQYRQERLGAAFLDSRHRILQQREIFIGTINNALVSTRDIIRITLLESAAAVVVYHNHPSGDSTPSDEDETFTKKLKHSLSYIDTELVDHLVIGAHRYTSMKERGML